MGRHGLEGRDGAVVSGTSKGGYIPVSSGECFQWLNSLCSFGSPWIVNPIAC